MSFKSFGSYGAWYDGIARRLDWNEPSGPSFSVLAMEKLEVRMPGRRKITDDTVEMKRLKPVIVVGNGDE